MGRRLPLAVAGALLVGALAACAHEDDARHERADPAPSYSVVPVPPRPMTGTIDAVLRQSSRDAARGRMQVWLFNGTPERVEPTRIRYVDPRLSRPVAAQRLRSMPSGLERGFPVPLPAPRCRRGERTPPLVVLETSEGTERLAVTDSIRVVEHHVDATCFALAVHQVVGLEWDDAVPSGPDVGTLTLVAAPTGRPGRLEVLRVGATPVLKHPRTTTWQPRRVVTGEGRPQRIDLPVVPARCDSHAFFESGGATAFRLRLRLDGEVGEIVLRMSPEGARAAIAYAIAACDLG